MLTLPSKRPQYQPVEAKEFFRPNHMNIVETYSHLVLAIGVMAFISIIQLLVADLIGIVSKHTPGTPVEANHDSVLFRASRVVANTNESISIFILAAAFCVLTSAPASFVGLCSWAYVVLRLLYAVCYYANLQIMRSVVFGLSILSLCGLLGSGFFAWFNG